MPDDDTERAILARAYVRRQAWLARLQVAELARAMGGDKRGNDDNTPQSMDDLAMMIGMTQV